MRIAADAFVAVVALAAGAAVGWFAKPPAGPSAEGPAALDRATARVKDLEAQVARLEAAAREAEAREAQRLAAAPRPPAPPPRATEAPAPGTGPAVPARDPKAPRIAPAGYDGLVAGVDWAAVGRSVRGMTPVLAQFGEEWARTGTIPTALVGRLSEMNGPLVSAALAAAGKLGLPLQRANTAFTHPVFSANALAAMLEEGGEPLSPAQLEELSRLAERFAREDANRVAGYDERTWELQKSIDESDLRDRFYEAAFATLTDAQRALLAPEAVRGRLQCDLFSSALVWAARVQLLPFATPEALATAMERQATRLLELGDDRAAVVKEVVARWAGGLPPSWTAEPADALSLLGMVPVGRVREAARLELRMLEDLVRSAGLDEEAARKVRATDVVLVPVRSPPK